MRDLRQLQLLGKVSRGSRSRAKHSFRSPLTACSSQARVRKALQGVPASERDALPQHPQQQELLRGDDGGMTTGNDHDYCLVIPSFLCR